ncbi:DUF2141 domain-containing protein [Rhodopirellula sp. MGV]|uniref:DUF2141 domain-containing protein n=1 Tax=Rhodopirellula sp. MGV TaxID=2023130 RepID=UPI000B97114A|nr:DUF2141 domain-containing protein [Rhodopirellula sp. MGV]OYP34010.1 hypothetical protein CGZ80_16470 [Rhodopirellula sp. MGV]PNY38363.1 DUF2141 domain-containing protein [Rhodopirellula baltica]
MPSPTFKFPAETRRKGQLKRAWKESHGTALLGFALLILLAGTTLIWTTPPPAESPDLESLANGSEPAAELPENALLIRVATDQTAATGPIRIAVYDSLEAFGNPEKAIIKDALQPIDGFVVWEIDLSFLPEEFSIAAFHDLDDNGVLNRALLNAPVEPYGFSNNARNLFGPPTYEQTLVKRPAEPEVIEIRVY